jgi:hypothetical protein
MTYIVAIATCVIAWYAYESNKLAKKNQKLTNETKTANEKHQEEMNKILNALVQSNYTIGDSESRKETQVTLKKEKSAVQKKFNKKG